MDSLERVLRFEIRSLLKYLIRIKKKRNPRFSQRAYASRLAFTPSTLNEILKGKRKLTKNTAQKLFDSLSKDSDVKSYLHKINARCPPKRLHELTSDLEQKAFDEIVKISNLAKLNSSSAPLFCTLIVAVNQVDFEFIRTKVTDTLKDHCLFENVYELRFQGLARTQNNEDLGGV